jgi:hypothetical protein
MTATMVAGFVDQSALSWDQPVIDAWSGSGRRRAS